MFEFFFKYPATIFRKGEFVLLGSWPLWLLGIAIAALAGLLFWHVRRHRGLLNGARPLAIWLLQTGLVTLVLLLLWHPAISVATLRPQQNVVAVLVDASRSMAIREGSTNRLEQVHAVLQGGLLQNLGRKFQVRLYQFGRDVTRVQKAEQIVPTANATRIGESLKEALAESATLPVGAIVLLSDGADNAGGIDLETISEVRRRRIPVHTMGFGREKFDRDLEIADVVLPPRALPDSRLSANLSFRQSGFAGKRARLAVRDGGKLLASQEVVLGQNGTVQTETLLFNAGVAGPKNLSFSLDPMEGEEFRENNAVTRLVNVQALKPGILYLEGEPRWEFKFIRRAAAEDRSLQMFSILRTTQNKFYTQVDADRKELEEGFPAKAEELFAYQGLIIGSVEASYFTSTQQELIREFVNRRGGGVLFLGGRGALGDGGYAASPLAELLPVRLPSAKGTFHRDQGNAELTTTGRLSVIARLAENPERNAERWKKMPLLADYQEVGEAKPGAVVLMEVQSGRKRSPLLAVQNYGRGRSAVFATSGSWRWQMLQDLGDQTHEAFWQQLLRYLVAETPGQVAASTPRPVLSDEIGVPLRVEVRDKEYKPVSTARVEARVIGPEGLSQVVELIPQPMEEGVYRADWTAPKPGSYIAEVVASDERQEIGRDVLIFRREDGVAEHFGAAQNRELLEKLSEQTGGRYYNAREAAKLSEEISYSEAGITTRETRDLWDMPAVFLLAMLLRGSEWLLRRRWGVV